MSGKATYDADFELWKNRLNSDICEKSGFIFANVAGFFDVCSTFLDDVEDVLNTGLGI